MSDLAKLYGKSNIYKFRIEIEGNVKTFDFLKVTHQNNGDVLCQVTNITRDRHLLIGDCKIIGYRDQGVLKNIRTPFEHEANIELASDEFIENTIGLNTSENNFIGVIEHHPNLKICLDLKKAITKHIAILAKSGAGKSYTVGVILEEVIKKNIPIVILDPHNEYASLKYPNTNEKDVARLKKFGLGPQGFLDRVQEFSPDTELNPQAKPINLDINRLTAQGLVDSLQQKLSPAQQNIIYNVLANSATGKINIDELIFNVSAEESNAKWSLISQLEQLKQLKLYSENPVPLTDIVKFQQCSIISLKGVDPFVSEVFVAGLLSNLFEARKKDEIPPFLLVLEEGHNFCPERSLGEKKASKTIRTIAGEGRKFGLGLCLISQRPAKVDKNVVSQCTTQILLKMTNPNDLKSVIQSSEGVSSDSEEEIQKLNIGSCLLTGVIDIPLKLNIRPRISKHGGESVDVTMSYEADDKYEKKAQEEKNQIAQNKIETQKIQQNINDQRMPMPNPQNPGQPPKQPNTTQKINQKSHPENPTQPQTNQNINEQYYQFIDPQISLQEAKTMQKNPNLKTHLIPATLATIKTNQGKKINILIDRVAKISITKMYPFTGISADIDFKKLTQQEKQIIPTLLQLNDLFNATELLMKTKLMFNEILRICDSLATKNLLEKLPNQQYKIKTLAFFKHINKLNFIGQQKFEELTFNKIHKETISETQVKQLLQMCGKIESTKNLYVVKYV